MNILYSFNKRGFEAEYWQREITAASTDRYRFIPFNHDSYLNPQSYSRAQLLDNLYFERHPGLMRMYAEFEAAILEHRADAVIVDTCPPYHPEFLRNLSVYKVLRVADGPITAYDRDFAYLHAYNQVLHHCPAYSRDMDLAEKLRYCGATNIDFWRLGVFDALHDTTKTEQTILQHERDIEILFIGALHFTKMPLMAKLKKAFGRRICMRGLANWKRNVYYNVNYGFPGWLRPVSFEQFVSLYQRTKIGINIHNRGMYTVGNYRLFNLPANGVMQISDGGKYLNQFFEVGEEIVRHEDADDLIDKINYYLEHDDRRQQIAMNGYRRVMRDHRIARRMNEAGELIEKGMARIGWKRLACQRVAS